MTPEAALIEQSFCIVDKAGRVVPFKLNETQAHYDEKRTKRDIIVKARQQGFSSFVSALIVLECIASENVRAVLIAHDSESTEKIFDRARFFVNNLGFGKTKMSVDLSRSSRREFYFKEKNSTFYIGTAGSQSFGRGDTINLLHCSEVAMWPDPQAMTAGLFQAVPRDGTIWLESTANGRGNWFHLQALKAKDRQSRFTDHFYPWWFFPEYSVPGEQMPRDFSLTEEEFNLQKAFGLTKNQLLWRREKMTELDNSDLMGGMNLFPQEYPSTFDEAFLASGQSVFRMIPFFQKDPLRVERFLTTYEEPQPKTTYVLGVDVSAGVGRDRSVIWGLNCDTFEQAFEWVSDCVDPDELGGVVAGLGKAYNLAFVAPELNNHGLATIDSLRYKYHAGRILQRYQFDKREGLARTDRLGWMTTEKSKSQMITNLRKALSLGGLKVYSEKSRNEFSTFVEKDGGRLEAQDGCFDDRVIAAALAVTGYKHLYQPQVFVEQPKTHQFSFKNQRALALGQFSDKTGVLPSEYFERYDSGVYM